MCSKCVSAACSESPRWLSLGFSAGVLWNPRSVPNRHDALPRSSLVVVVITRSLDTAAIVEVFGHETLLLGALRPEMSAPCEACHELLRQKVHVGLSMDYSRVVSLHEVTMLDRCAYYRISILEW